MSNDIQECYNVLDAQGKRSLGIRFMKAGSWNKQLAELVSRFALRREQLQFALNLRTAITVEEISTDVKYVMRMMEMFATMLSQQEQEIGKWIHEKGGVAGVLNSDENCAEMIEYETELNSSAGGFEAQPANVEALRDEYQADVQTIIKGNLESSTKTFELGLYNLGIEGIPLFMGALEDLTLVYPALRAPYLTFKFLYQAQQRRRYQDTKQTTVMGKIQEIMLAFLELRHSRPDDLVLQRINAICDDIGSDMNECYNVLDAYGKCPPTIKLFQSSSWNTVLVALITRLSSRQWELKWSLSTRTALAVDTISAAAPPNSLESESKSMMEVLTTMLSPSEEDMSRWIQRNGGELAILESDAKCAEMLRYEATLTFPGRPMDPGNPSGDAKAIAEYKKYYRQDVQDIIQGNLERSSRRLELGLRELSENLATKMHAFGDRVIRELGGSPHNKIKDSLVFGVWKSQGWRGTVKTRALIIALRDHFIERVESPTYYIDEDQDPEMDTHGPLPDGWATSYLQDKRLRYLEQVFDPDSSGFTTISEINAFTAQRPANWSLPRWIAYWAIGWQIFATKYCQEIEDLFAQIFQLRERIRQAMSGNTRYVNEYIDGTWGHVMALTSAIERYELPAGAQWLEEKFADHVQWQEENMQRRLETIGYRVDALDTVSLIVGDPYIEQPIFLLLVLLMRRHAAKMQLGLSQELDERELDDDVQTLTWVVDAAWYRFQELKEHFLDQGASDLKQRFEWLSCGIFKNYWQWNSQSNRKHFMDRDWTPGDSTLDDFEPSELVGILTYPDAPQNPSSVEQTAASISSTPAALVQATQANPTVDPNASALSIAGQWYGWHWTKTRRPYGSMVSVNIQCKPSSDDEAVISGHTLSIDGGAGTLSGSLEDGPDDFEIQFNRVADADDVQLRYSGTFLSGKQTIIGIFEDSAVEGSFVFKKVATSTLLCSRPLSWELNAEELWDLARSALLEGINSRKPTSSYLSGRIAKLRGVLEFLYRNDFNSNLDDEHPAGYSAVLKGFSFEVMSDLWKLYSWYIRSTELHPRGYFCDNCADPIRRSRVLCLECINSDHPENTLDLCHKVACVASTSIQRTDVTHLSSHLMIKTRDFLFLAHYFAVKHRAGLSLGYAQRELQNLPLAVGEEPSTTDTSPRCIVCREQVATPCWSCIDCAELGTWVCDACEKIIEALLPWDFQKRLTREMWALDAHNVSHILVRVVARTEFVDAVVPSGAANWEAVERQLRALVEERFDAVNERLDGVEKKLTTIIDMLTVRAA
ncbi:hypothetical protein C8R46DRAFT_35064 [Mycena filopes]|nr:hypothetical protein C8R46DRAFT_35064 [Mycena filopes]